MIKQIDFALFSSRNLIPNEFARKPNSIKEYDQWKATELRQFLLYSGPIVLKSVLEKTLYDHFLLFHVVIFILTSEVFCRKYLAYAHELLVTFVEHSSKMYGKEFVVYNVYNLVHLCYNVKSYVKSMLNVLENFSAFSFENFLGRLKRMVRKLTDLLTQIIRRHSEFSSDFYLKLETIQLKLLKKHNIGPIFDKHKDFEQYQKCVLNSCIISVQK